MPELRSYTVDVVVRYNISGNTASSALQLAESRLKPALAASEPGGGYPTVDTAQMVSFSVAKG